MAEDVDLADVKTIAQVIELARDKVESGLYAWAAAGAGQEVTLVRNQLALNQLALVPRVMNDVGEVDTSTSFLGVPLSLPVMLFPDRSPGALRPRRRHRLRGRCGQGGHLRLLRHPGDRHLGRRRSHSSGVGISFSSRAR